MIKEVVVEEKEAFDKLAVHPLQSYEWGEFREKTGLVVSRLGRYEGNKLVETAQVSWHKIPRLPICIGYWPKGVTPSEEMVAAVKEEAAKHKAILVKLEPNVLKGEKAEKELQALKRKFEFKKGRALFTKWSFWLDLDKSEEELMEGMKSKTRYNTRLAERKGVEISEDQSEKTFNEYWKLSEETMKRQGFYAHTKKYHEQMWETMGGAGIAHLFKGSYKKKTLVTWIVFLLNGVLYYPYGASTRDDSNVFASNLMMWEVIKWGKNNGAKLFDMWGSPGPDPKPTDNWYGFHRFKEGYGAKLVEFVGTYDLVVSPWLYFLYRLGNDYLRWGYLRLRAKFGK